MLNDVINKWLDIIRWAPSADNFQPWTTSWEILTDERIEFLLKVDSKFQKPHEVDIALNTIALGCLSQNLISIAAGDGYVLNKISIVPDGFSVILQMASVYDPTPWADLIRKRQTRRGLFHKRPIAQSDLNAIKDIVQHYEGLDLKLFITDLPKVAGLISRLDVIRYQNTYHLEHFLHALRFTKENIPEGLDIKSLEVPWIGQLTLLAITRFPFLRFIVWIGIEHIFTYLGCTRLLINSSALLHLSAKEYHEWSWFNIGRCLQEIWLYLTKQGISAQPFGHSLISFDYHLTPSAYSTRHQKIVENVRQQFLQLGSNINNPGIFLRLGFPTTEMTCRSQRHPITQFNKIN